MIELPVAKAHKLLVVGEVVLDRYLWGTVERVSPEAPIPVLRLNRSEERLGNAAFVAASVHALGGEAQLLSIIGADQDGRAVRRIVEELGLRSNSLLEMPDRCTIVKERMLGATQSAGRGVQQMLRVDREDSTPLDRTTEAALLASLDSEIDNADGVLICDINKGVLTPRLLNEIIRLACLQQKPVIVDPRLTDDFSIYRGATALTPNRLEAQRATGLSLASAHDWLAATKKLVDELDLSATLVTLDRDGMFLSERNGAVAHIETTPREVYDVTGAGDVVLAVFGFLLTAGFRPIDAAKVANVAASLEVTKQGATVISRSELATALRGHRDTRRKICSLQELQSELNPHRQAGRRICFVEGNFALDLRNVRLFELAHLQADALVAGVRPGPGASPILDADYSKRSAADQAHFLAALEAVDYVLMFDGLDPLETVRTIRPDVFVATVENRSAESLAIGRLIRSYGGRTITVRLTNDHSILATTEDGYSHHSASGDVNLADFTDDKRASDSTSKSERPDLD